MNPDQIKRLRAKGILKSKDEGTIEQRIDRYLEIDHQWIIGDHYFAEASSECINLYRDSYFISAVMVSQAVNEGIIRFIAERNNINLQKIDHEGKNITKSMEQLIGEFEGKSIISPNCVEASRSIYNSFRNDVHHMNPTVADIPFQECAKKNLQNLSTIEKEIFGVNSPDGKLVPHQPKYWDIQKDGTVPGFLRCE